jgi:DNA modification methylase
LPGLEVIPHLIDVPIEAEGQLFPTDLGGVGGRATVRKETLDARCRRAADLVAAEPDEPWLLWCGLNAEATALARMIPDSINVDGSWSPEDKATALLDFADGKIKRLITKPSIAAFGLNWQHCARMAFVGLSDSYEAYYQAIRRCYRYGQTRVVHAHVVLSELEGQIAVNVSPPFASLFTYSPSERDLGNSASRAEFIEHYGYIIRENLRVTVPGRIACIHVQQLTTTKVTHGYTGLTDFRGDVIRAYIDNGWYFHGEVTVNKDPQAQAIRTKAHALTFATKNRDSAGTRPALADYLLLFRKPGDNPIPIKNDVSNDEWIEWAQPVWWDIKETNTLNVRVARDEADERHICPLQLDFIERCVRLWSNPGEIVLSPFAGIGSEVYMARKLGRYGLGCELKPSYWRTAVDNLERLESEMGHATLLDELAI